MNDLIAAICPAADEKIRAETERHLNALTKPPGSLGRLEEIAVRYCLCKGTSAPPKPSMTVFTFAGDHGITAEAVTPYPKEVTRQMVLNMVRGGAAASVMCRTAGIGYSVVDMGVDADFTGVEGVIDRKVGRGTKNFCVTAAMEPAECETAMRYGYDLIAGSDADLVGVGEMGIGNSSSAAALYAMLLNIDDAGRTVGPGTGSAGEVFQRKVDAVRRGVALHRSQWDGSPFEALRRVGGFEICGMVGAILGGAAKRVPVVVDGFIAGAAGCAASRITPAVRDYIFYSHASAETFHREFLRIEGVRPILDLDLRLGEGTGAILAMQIIAQAIACYTEMATFSSAGVSDKNV